MMFQIDPDMTKRELEPIANLAEWDTKTVSEYLAFYKLQAKENPIWEQRVIEMREELERRATGWTNIHA